MSASSVAAAEAKTGGPGEPGEPGEDASVAAAAAAAAAAQASGKDEEADRAQRLPQPRTSGDPSEGAEKRPGLGVKTEEPHAPPPFRPLMGVIPNWISMVPTDELPELPSSVSGSESSTTGARANLKTRKSSNSIWNMEAMERAPTFSTSQQARPVPAANRRRLTKSSPAHNEKVQNPFAPLTITRKHEILLAPVRGLKNGINWVEWARFRSSLCIPEVFVIDALVGKPVREEILNVEGQKLYLDTLETDLFESTLHLPRILSKLANGDQGSPRPPSQLELPERIRINSRFLNGLLRSLKGSPYSSAPPTEHRAIYYSPFVGLLALESKLRDRLQSYSQAPTPASIPSPVQSSDRSPQSHASISVEVSDSDADEVAGRNRSEKAHLELLCGFIDEVIHRRLSYLADPATRLIYYSDLWHLFVPGAIVVARDDQQAYRVLSIESAGAAHAPCTLSRALRPDQFAIAITLVHIDTDGSYVGPVTTEFKLTPFEGERDVTTGGYYPIRFSKTPNLRQKLIDRGRLFVDMLEMKHMHYTGLTLDDQYEVDCQVVVDNESALSFQGGSYASWRPQLRDMTGSFPQPPPATECREFCCRHETARDDRQAEHALNAQYTDSLVPQSSLPLLPLAVAFQSCGKTRDSRDTITEEELLIMGGRVFGFLLHSRRWAVLAISRLSAPYKAASETSQTHKVKGTIPLGESFDQLVLPPGHKELVKSLISQHFRDKKADREYEQPDIVRGKGKGLILLLHGAPGVGKTTTAETVAEYFKKPLFHITCGDLGMWAKDVEESLERNFKLANRWGCILLLDEAEVFLAARTPKDHVRNSLVAVFLRVLEYYAGVLFVTTNRLGDFDEAFASRVHMSLYYPPLSLEATQQVLALNLNRARNRLLRQGRTLEINQLAVGGFLTGYWHANPRGRWNGRQIRNACQTALALAEYEARSSGESKGEGGGGGERAEEEEEGGDAAVVALDVRHFQKVADAYMGFMNYMRDIYGVDPDVRAAEMAIRAKPGSVDAAAAAARQGGFSAASATPINPYSSPPAAAGGFYGGQAQQQYQPHMGGGGGGGGGGISYQPEPPQGANAGFMTAQGLSAGAAFEGAAANPYPQAQHVAGMFAQGFGSSPLPSHPQATSASGAYPQYQWGASTNQNMMASSMPGTLQVPMPGASSPGVAMSAATSAGFGPELAPSDVANRGRGAGLGAEAGEQGRSLGPGPASAERRPNIGGTFIDF